MELLAKNRDLKILAEYGKKLGIKFVYYCPAGGTCAWWAVDDNPSLMIAIPIDSKLECIIPLDRLEQKFRLAHELGHAENGLGICPHEKCFNALYRESCFWREKLAWLKGLEILERLSILSAPEKEEYLLFALRCIRKEAAGCIRRLLINLTEIFSNQKTSH